MFIESVQRWNRMHERLVKNLIKQFIPRRVVRGLALLAVATLGACVHVPPPGIGEAVSWDRLPGWNDERHAQAWPALQAGCKVLPQRDPSWVNICLYASLLAEPDDAAARAFFETNFTAYAVYADEGKQDGLVTGYYEPLLYGSRTRTERYRYPIYARPDDLLIVDLGEVYPELKGKRLRGRIDGRRVVPYHSRAQIENSKRPAAKPIVWVDDSVALFFLHVQGSGRVQLAEGDMLFVGYADQNGHPYRSLGRRLVDMGVMKLEDVTMQSMRAWLAANPEQIVSLLNSNPSYIFFEERNSDLPGPIGALKVPLLAERAIAVDPAFVPLGVPVWLDTTLPEEIPTPYRRLVFAQDTGGAIKGPVRADLFFGFGDRAEDLAGKMKQPGRLYVLLPTVRVTAR
jgi:membrane-bound lytic murein transglycosylase A